jgi:hypothetical protein
MQKTEGVFPLILAERSSEKPSHPTGKLVGF